MDNMTNKGLYTLAEESRKVWNILVLTFREATYMIQEKNATGRCILPPTPVPSRLSSLASQAHLCVA